MNTPDTEARERMEYFREFGKEKDNTPDTEVTTGDPQTSHASAIIKYPTPDTEDWEKEFDSFFQARIWNTKEGETLGHWNAPDVFTMKKFISSTVSSRDTYWKERVELVRNENIECVADNAEDYIRKEKGGNPLPTVEESAVRGFVQYLRENTTTPLPMKII